MTIKYLKYVIGDGEYYPTVDVKIEKGDNRFLYCIVLTILRGEETVELCHIDNCHDKGDHIHYPNKDGTFRQEAFDYQGIDKTILYLQSNWKKIMDDDKNA